ncbi:MAG: DUF2628 domain-containing protein [Gemmatimonadaceae bacterium]|nr:DUF2628 domain-containing protein [Gemmatimonadaceae bacterium]
MSESHDQQSLPDDTSGSPPTPPELPRWAQQSATSASRDEAFFAAYVGPRWESVYRRKLQPFFEDPSFVPTWNWSAALFGPLWFIYRKLYLQFAVFFLAPLVAFRLLAADAVIPQTMEEMLKPENQYIVNLIAAVRVSLSLAAGGTANWFLFRRARAARRFAETQDVDGLDSLAVMRRLGGVNRTGMGIVLAMMAVQALASMRG